MKRKIIVIISALFMLGLGDFVFALEEPLTVNGKEIITRLTRVEEGQKEVSTRLTRVEERQTKLEEGQKELNTRLTRVEEGQKELSTRLTRVEERQTKLEEGQKELREGQIKVEEGQKALVQRIDDLKDLNYVLLGGILALVGFVLWDRRSTISPVIQKTKELEKSDDLTMKILEEYARKEPKMAEILKSLGLL